MNGPAPQPMPEHGRTRARAGPSRPRGRSRSARSRPDEEVEKKTAAHSARVTSSVVFVAELGRSIEFYRDIFSCEATLEPPGAALLLAPGGFQIYLIAKGRGASHQLGGIGVQYLMWAVETAAALADLEQAINDRGGRTYTYASGGVSFLESRDPDGIRILVAYPGPERLPRSLVENRLHS